MTGETARPGDMGRTGLRISELFLGAMTFREQGGVGATLPECRRILDAYADAGGKVVDTASNNAVRTGKVLYTGISDTPAWVVSQAQTLADWRGWTPFAGLQVAYSLLQRDVERSASCCRWPRRTR